MGIYLNEFIKSYKFKQVSEKELFKLRCDQEEGVVFKTDGKYYYANENIDKIVSYFRKNNTHLCGTCKHLSAAPDCDGGCANIRDLLPEAYSIQYADKVQRIHISNRIEKYQFVHEGIETFNLRTGKEMSLIITECDNFEYDKPKPRSK